MPAIHHHLHQPDERDPTRRRVIVAKNKEGQTGAIELRFDGEIQRFSEIDDRYEGE